MMEPPEVQSIKSMLHIARILAIIFGIILFIAGLAYAAAVAYYASVCSSFVGYDPYCGGAVAGALIAGIWLIIGGVVAVVVYLQMKSIEQKVNNRQYEAAKSQTLIWMILGFIFGIILGIILLIAYIKFDPVINWSRGQTGGGMPTYAAPMSPGATPAVAPAPPPPGQPGAAPFCPKCGQPTTYVAQYGRYYCYNDKQYV
jgi:membrane protease YdiL (CAAX protease family)